MPRPTTKTVNFRMTASIRQVQLLFVVLISSSFTAVHCQQAFNKKVSISNGVQALEVTPLSSITNGLLIQPINVSTQKGINASFYLNDTSSSWRFYTNGSQRFSILGNGQLNTSGPLLINNATYDPKFSLRVKGYARFDTGIHVRAASDNESFISLNRNVRSFLNDPDDGISSYTTTPIEWSDGGNIPVFRIRHPNNTSNMPYSISAQKDFMILPYQYGMAIEYNGVVECWVGEWSIHKGLNYSDPEGNGTGWGGVLWVGDDLDMGGVRSTARNNLPMGGSLNYGELSVEKFSGESHGDFRFRLPSASDHFEFVYGRRGDSAAIFKVKKEGIVAPVIGNADLLIHPEVAQIAFDSTDKQFIYYNGLKWAPLNGLYKGSSTQSATIYATTYSIPHGIGKIPSYYNVNATSLAAAGFRYITADDTNIYIHYATPPNTGSNNLSWTWMAQE